MGLKRLMVHIPYSTVPLKGVWGHKKQVKRFCYNHCRQSLRTNHGPERGVWSIYPNWDYNMETVYTSTQRTNYDP